jgi:hypothetical protein
MSSSTSTLPAGWSTILDEVHQRLDHAIAQADARMTALPPLEIEALGSERRQEINRWHERLSRLSMFLESTEQLVHSVDEALEREESLLRQHLTTSQTLRQKLAEGTGRAIG